jgi:hypothetical protein
MYCNALKFVLEPPHRDPARLADQEELAIALIVGNMKIDSR